MCCVTVLLIGKAKCSRFFSGRFKGSFWRLWAAMPFEGLLKNFLLKMFAANFGGCLKYRRFRAFSLGWRIRVSKIRGEQFFGKNFSFFNKSFCVKTFGSKTRAPSRSGTAGVYLFAVYRCRFGSSFFRWPATIPCHHCWWDLSSPFWDRAAVLDPFSPGSPLYGGVFFCVRGFCFSRKRVSCALYPFWEKIFGRRPCIL